MINPVSRRFSFHPEHRKIGLSSYIKSFLPPPSYFENIEKYSLNHFATNLVNSLNPNDCPLTETKHSICEWIYQNPDRMKYVTWSLKTPWPMNLSPPLEMAPFFNRMVPDARNHIIKSLAIVNNPQLSKEFLNKKMSLKERMFFYKEHLEKWSLRALKPTLSLATPKELLLILQWTLKAASYEAISAGGLIKYFFEGFFEPDQYGRMPIQSISKKCMEELLKECSILPQSHVLKRMLKKLSIFFDLEILEHPKSFIPVKNIETSSDFIMIDSTYINLKEEWPDEVPITSSVIPALDLPQVSYRFLISTFSKIAKMDDAELSLAIFFKLKTSQARDFFYNEHLDVLSFKALTATLPYAKEQELVRILGHTIEAIFHNPKQLAAKNLLIAFFSMSDLISCPIQRISLKKTIFLLKELTAETDSIHIVYECLILLANYLMKIDITYLNDEEKYEWFYSLILIDGKIIKQKIVNRVNLPSIAKFESQGLLPKFTPTQNVSLFTEAFSSCNYALVYFLVKKFRKDTNYFNDEFESLKSVLKLYGIEPFRFIFDASFNPKQ